MAYLEKNDTLKKYGFEEEYDEETDMNWRYTGYPNPKKRYRAIFETFDQSKNIEESYFWILEHLRDLGAVEFDKIKDFFSASEQSSLSGVNKQRLGMTQDKISQYLRGINELMKQLFQQVRELRWIDERLNLYKDSEQADSKTKESAEISLKGIWIELVEGGAQNSTSIYGMAREVGFGTLPDLFFGVPPIKLSQVDEQVNNIAPNKKVRDALKRKLRMYYEWKNESHKELIQRKKFTLATLRQVYDTIQLYIHWIKPYMQTAKRLSADEGKVGSVDMVTAFEGSMVEIEFMAKNYVGGKPGKDDVYGVVLINFNYRTRPQMAATSPDYAHRGPIHVGKLEINWRTYAWSGEEIENYKKCREEEDFRFLGNLDASLKEGLDQMGDELKKFLDEAKGRTDEEEDKIEQEEKSMNDIVKDYFDPLVSIFRGFKDAGDAITSFPDIFKTPVNENDIKKPAKLLKPAFGVANFQAWTCYKNYKKSHGMLAW